MKGGARSNNTSCVNTSEKNWLWWRVVRDLTIHHVSIHQKRIDHDEGWCARMGSGEEGKWWWRGVVKKGSDDEGEWWRREVMMKGSGDEGEWWRREVVKKGSGEEGKWWRREVVTKGSGEVAGARNLVFFRVTWLQATMKGTSSVRRVRLRSFRTRLVPPMGFARIFVYVRSSMRFLKLWLQIALEWPHEGCMGNVVGRKPEHETLCVFRVKWLQPAMKGTSSVRRVRLGSFCARMVPPMCFAKMLVHVCVVLCGSSLSGCMIALEWLHECCMGYVVGRKPEHETLCFSV